MNFSPSTHLSPNAAVHFPDGEPLALSQLTGYQEDPVTQRAFERSHLPISLPGVAIAFGSFYLLFTDRIDVPTGLLAFVAGWAICLVSVVRAWRAIPTSRISGRPMLRFRRSDGPSENNEFIYVDPESRTYFCRVAATSS